jgi:hypothetical protein
MFARNAYDLNEGAGSSPDKDRFPVLVKDA